MRSTAFSSEEPSAAALPLSLSEPPQAVRAAVPAVITFVIINTFWFWNDYLLTQMMLSRKALRTIQLAMQAMFNDAFYAWDTALAALTLSIIPLLIFFVILQRNIIEGMSAGSVKG